MHPQSPPLIIGGTVLKDSGDIDILEVTFDFNMTFEKHLRSVSEQLLKDLVSLGCPGKYSMIDCFLGDTFGVLSWLLWSTLLQCGAWGADTHLKPLELVVSDARFLTGGVFEWNIAHRRSLAVLCMLHKIRCIPMHPLYGSLLVPYVPVRVTHWYTYLCVSSLQNL